MANTRRLGEVQISCLKTLGDRGDWYAGGGWAWSNYSGTLRIMEGLARRGLVENVGEPARSRRERYVLTEDGRAFLAESKRLKPPQKDVDEALLTMAVDGRGEWHTRSGFWVESVEYTKICMGSLVAEGYAVETSKDHWAVTGGKGFDRARALGYEERAALYGE